MAPASSTPVLHHDMLVAITELCDYSDLRNLRLACKPLLEAVHSSVIEIRLNGRITPEQMRKLVELFPRANSLDVGRSQRRPGAIAAPDTPWMLAFLKLCRDLSQSLSRVDLGGCSWTNDKFVSILLLFLHPSQLKTLVLRESGLLSPRPLQARGIST